jgi:hypothetical protein
VLGDIYVNTGERARARSCYTQGLEVAIALGARVDVDKLRQALARVGPADVAADVPMSDERDRQDGIQGGSERLRDIPPPSPT